VGIPQQTVPIIVMVQGLELAMREPVVASVIWNLTVVSGNITASNSYRGYGSGIGTGERVQH
jgi:hypothetical protein